MLMRMSANDHQLLELFAREGSQDAFTEVVRRYLNLVYSAALRQVRSPELAEEVAQTAFTQLARQAARLAPDTILSAWLYQVTRHAAIDVVRSEARRQAREQIAIEMSELNDTNTRWTQIEPLLDEAMQSLDETDESAAQSSVCKSLSRNAKWRWGQPDWRRCFPSTPSRPRPPVCSAPWLRAQW